MSYTHWHVGMKVVCIDGETSPDCVTPAPKLNDICTVSWIGIDGNDVLIDLEEYPSPETQDWYRGWLAQDFRPVQPRNTDISIFTAMLNPSKVEERA